MTKQNRSSSITNRILIHQLKTNRSFRSKTSLTLVFLISYLHAHLHVFSAQRAETKEDNAKTLEYVNMERNRQFVSTKTTDDDDDDDQETSSETSGVTERYLFVSSKRKTTLIHSIRELAF